MRNALKAVLSAPQNKGIPKALAPHVKAYWDAEKKGDVIYPFPQLTINGDFSNGTTGWRSLYAALSINSAGNMEIAADGSNANPTTYKTNIGTIKVRDKIYVCAPMRVTNANCQRFQYEIRDSGPGNYVHLIQVCTSPAINVWYKCSAVFTNTLIVGGYATWLRHRYADAATAADTVAEVPYCITLNLTEIFGAGNEPTAAEMDDILSKSPIEAVSAAFTQVYPNGNFANGTTDITCPNAVVSVVNNILTFVGDGSAATMGVSHNIPNNNAIAGTTLHGVYKFRVRDAVCLRVKVRCGSTPGEVTILNPVQDQWYTISVEGSHATLPYMYVLAAYADATTQVNKILEIEYLQVFSLTNIFGTGNEPSKAEMDAFMSGRAYWEGTQTLSITKVLQYWEGSKNVKCNPDNKYYWADTMGKIEPIYGSLNQLITNGNFAVDTNADGVADSWTIASSATNKSVLNGIQTFRATAQNQTLQQSVAVQPTAGDIMYLCAFIKTDGASTKLSNNCGAITTVKANTALTFVSVRAAKNEFSELIQIYDGRTADWTDISVSKVMRCNLTATFGAGNEPTQTQMDAIIQKIGIYFEGVRDNVLLNPLEEAQFGLGRHLKLNGFAYNAASGWQSNPASLLGDGVDDIVVRSESFLIPSNRSFSVSTVVSRPSTAIAGIFSATRDSMSSGDVSRLYTYSQAVYYILGSSTGSSTTNNGVSPITLLISDLMLYTFVYDQTTRKGYVYVNNSFVRETAQIETGVMCANYLKFLWSGSAYYVERLGLSVLFNKALTAQEVKNLHNGFAKRFGLPKA